MSICLEVVLLSGKTAIAQAGWEEEVETLKWRAQAALGVGKGRLVHSFGGVRDASAAIKTTRLQDGDALTLHVNTVQVQASSVLLRPVLAMDQL